MQIEILEISNNIDGKVSILGNGKDRLNKMFAFSVLFDVANNKILSFAVHPKTYKPKCPLKNNILFEIRKELKQHRENFI